MAAELHPVAEMEGVAAGLSPLSECVWRSMAGSRQLGDVSAWLTWEGLTVRVLNSRGEAQTVLQGLSGYAEPGHFMAIMGPSGSGKSTLLDALAGRLAATSVQTGQILLNGRPRKLSYGTAAYVTQEDDLIGTLTVRETITYSANLRLPDKMSASDKKAIIESVIDEMGLRDCADTPVGNWHLRGISGGEKRRLSIGIEFLMRPRLLFLDEPTSGLDSAAAFMIIQTVKNLARDGRTIISSIHQPSSEVFELFDSLYLLSNGRTVYFGKASEACNFFAESGFPCPPLRNPSDHFLRCINSDFDRVKATLKGSFRLQDNQLGSMDPLQQLTTIQAIDILVDSFQLSQYAMNGRAKAYEISQIKGNVLESGGSQASFWRQCFTLTCRSFTNMSRDMGYYWLRLVIYIIVSICVGTMYFNVGTSYNAILARGSCQSFIFGFITFMSIGGFPSFVEDMKVFQRERMNGHYGVSAFVVGNSLSSMPFLLLISLVSSTICYYMVRLHPGFEHYAYFTLGLYASIMVVEGMMMTIASIVPNFLMGIITGAGIQGIYMLLAGYFRLPKDIPKPVWRYPLSYMSFDYWALQGQYQNDFLGLEFDSQSPLLPKIQGAYLVKDVFEIDVSRSKWWDLSAIFGMAIAYRIVFLVMIKISEDFTPWVRGCVAKHLLKRKSSVHNTLAPSRPTAVVVVPSSGDRRSRRLEA